MFGAAFFLVIAFHQACCDRSRRYTDISVSAEIPIGVEILSIPDPYTVNVQHFWVTDNGETLTIDTAQARGTFVREGLFAIADYKVRLIGGTGRIAGATGEMNAIGGVDFGRGHVILRYSGEICRR